MILSSWLAAVFGRLKASSIQSRRRRRGVGRPRNPSITPTIVEMLEQRQLLTNPAVTSAVVNFNGNSEIFPYGQNSIANGTVVTTVTVTDPDAPPGDYTPGHLAITGGNVDVNGDGNLAFKVGVINVGGVSIDAIEVNDSRDLYLYSGVTSFSLTVTATDNTTPTGATGTGVITINLTPPLNQRPVIPQYGYGSIDNIPDGSVNVLQVKENSFAGTVVGNVTAVDPDAGDQSTLTYAFVGTVPGFNSATPAFAIDPFTGKITVKDPTFLDYEARRKNIGSVVGDLGEGGLSGYADVVFDVQVQATDNRGIFSLTSHTYQGGGVLSASHVYIRLRDVGETPPDVSQSTKSMSVNENSPKGLSVGYFDLIDGTPNFVNGPPRTALAGLDPTEPQQTHSFAIVGGNPNNTFAIDYTTGEITVNNPVINYEALNVYNLQIAVTDENAAAVALGAVDNVAPLTTVATLHITVNDINEPTTIPNGQNFSIPENTVNGTVVGTVVANDPDTQQPNGQAKLVYSIISGNVVKVNGVNYQNVFSIDPNTGVISVNNQTGLAQNVALNFENQPSFSLTVLVVDRGDLSTSANNTVVINLSNVNETPPSFSDTSFTIAENRPLNTLVGKVTAAVGEIGNTINAYQITAGNTNGAFAIDNLGNITVANAAMINYETNPQFVLTVKATDNGNPPLFATAHVTINITNLNEQIAMLDQQFSVNENTPNGIVVGQIITSDPDNIVSQTQGTHFVITGGNIGGAFAIDDQGHITVNNVSALNYEVNPSFTLAVTVNDTGLSAVPTTSASASITISLINVNDAPVIGNQSFNVREHSLAGTVVGKVQATDEDVPAQKLTYTIISGDPTGAFTLDPNTAVITINDPHLIDYNTTPIFHLTVQVTDNGSPSLSSTATVQINLQSLSAPHITSQPPVTVPENSSNGTFVTAVAATGGVTPYTFSIIGGNTNNAFSIAPGTGAYLGMGVITVNDVNQLNYESLNTFGLRILVQDSQSTPLGDTATVTVNLSNVNEPPILLGIEGTALNWVENNPGQYASNLVTPVTASLLVTDTDGPSQKASKATVQITGNYQSGEDQLSFTPIGNITGSFVNGILTLTGIDSQANYQAALRSVAYTDTSNAPNTLKRTVTYQIFDDGTDGVNPPGTPLPSNTVTRDINIIPVNDPPTLQGIETSALNWIENTPPNYLSNNVTPTTSTLTTADPDSVNLTGATIQITGNYLKTEDQLVFTNTAKITGAWDPATGKLTLTGTDTLANYTAALQAVSYTDTSNAPNTLTRTLTYQVADDGPLLSNTVTRNITITPINDPPVLSGIEGTALNWIENTPPNYASNNVTPITGALVAGDPDSTILTGATVQITGNYLKTEDQLVFTNTANISGAFNSTTGTLTLSGTDTLANYTAALRSVSYTDLSNAPNPLKRTVSYQVTDDGALTSNIVTRDINIMPVNDPPVLSAIEGNPLNWIENTPPNFATNNVTPITGSLVASDPDSMNLTGATIQITGNYQITEDQLVFTNTANITGTWNAATGKLTLTGTDTLANYTAALEAVSYTDTSNAPSILKRTVTFQVTDDGPLPSNAVSRDITITPVNDPPVLSGIEASALTWAENTPPNYASNNITPVTATLVASDPDSVNLSGATIKITGNYQSTEDKLVFTNTSNITGTFDPISGTLTLTGADTLANYTAALRTVAYTDISDVPNTLKRTVTYQVSDDGPSPSNTVTRDIVISPVNDPPKLSGIEGTALNWIENTPPVYTPNNVTPITATLVAGDPDSMNLTGATVQITGNYQQNQDRVVFVNTAKITGSFDVTTGKLTLIGTDTPANYTAALDSVAYTDRFDAPNTSTRTVTYQVTDDGALPSNTVTRDITITPVNDPPALIGLESFPVNYIENSTVAVTGTIVATDPDSSNAQSATIQFTTNYVPTEDTLLFTNTPKITGTFNPGTGILSLTGVDSLTNYRAAIRSVSYYNTSDNPSAAVRTLGFQITDDSGLPSATVYRNINVIPVNDAPVLTSSLSTLNYTEGTGAQPINPATTVYDVDSPTLAGATITLVNYYSDQDVLGFVNVGAAAMGNIAIQSNAGGVLQLISAGATATQAQWQAAFDSVTYTNTSQNPNATPRTVTFVADDGGNVFHLSNMLTTTITVIPVNNPPTLTNPSNVTYTENGAPLPIDAVIGVSDPDNTTFPSGVVTITNFLPAEDQINFINDGSTMGDIAIQSNVNGVLTLVSTSGTATTANWQAAFAAVTYYNTSDNPSNLTRTVTYTISDGALTSNVLTSTVNVIPVNDPPALSGIETTPLQYFENTAPNFATNNTTTISALIQASDPDSLLTGATIQITGNYIAGQDFLVFANTSTIQGSYDTTTGTLTLTGSDTVANYTTALESVAYFNRSDSPNTLTRTVSYTVTDDGGPSGTPKLASNTVTRDITVTAVNDPPVLTNPDTPPLNYIEDAPSLPILANVALTDADSNNMSGATIAITGNYNANGSQDTLTFVNTATITGNWNPATGVLTLTGLDSVSNYRTALRSIGFTNQYDAPTAPTRTVTFTVVDDTAVSSNLISRDINITTVPDGAILSSIETTPKVYKALDPYTPATPITSTIVVTDYDSLNQTSAVVQISNNYVRGQDQLVIDAAVLNANQLNAAWDPVTGKLTLTGTAPTINYQNALQAVKYINTGSTPSTATRTVSFQTFDDTTPSPLASNTVTRNIAISTANVPPLLSVNSAAPLAYSEKDPATNIAPNLSIVDADSPNMNGATIKITGNYLFPQDQLVFMNTGTIQGSWNASNGTLTLTGLDTISNYQAALKAVKYLNTSNNPSTLKRTVSFLVTDGLATSNAATRDINVTPVNDPPSIQTNSVAPLPNAGNGNPVAIAPALTVIDPDSANLASAQVAISFNYQRGLDLLTFRNTSKITGSFDVASGILTLSGIDTVSNYRLALQSVMYTFTGTPVGGSKTISFSATDDSDAVSINVPGVTTRDIIFNTIPPVLKTNSIELLYPTGNVAVAIAPGLTVTTAQSNFLASAVVQITSNYVNSTDVLAFTNTSNITSTFDASTGRLTLTGLDTVSNYRAALQSVTYTFNGAPSGPAKTITFSASDGISVSNFSTVNVYLSSAPSVVSVNDLTNLTVNSTPVAIAPGLTVTDPYNDYLFSAKIIISSNYVKGTDSLTFANTSKITGSFDQNTGILTLSGIDTVGAYREALRTVLYGYTGTPTGTRTISFSVNNGFTDSNIATRNLVYPA